MSTKKRLILFAFLLQCALGQNKDAYQKEELHHYIENKSVLKKPQKTVGKRKHGIEFNPFGLFLQLDPAENLLVSFGYSYFGLDSITELSLPILYRNAEDGYAVHIDLHYRRFITGEKNGFYVSGMLRYTRIKSEIITYFFEVNENTVFPEKTTNNFGLGMGLGWRFFNSSNFYWGASFSFGQYLVNNIEEYKYEPLISSGYFVDLEFLKIGYFF